MVNLKEKPFYLNGEDLAWVESTLKAMTLEEKVGQLFFPIGLTNDKEQLKALVAGIHPGGILYRPGPMKDMQEVHNYLQSISAVPLLIAANLEAGGNGTANEGTIFGNQLQIAATEDREQAYRLGVISAKEGSAVGCNLAFAPVVDIDQNFRNPITNVRTYGSSAERVTRMASAFIEGMHEQQMAVSIKHFPGDGVDERDQHLLTSVNSLSVEEWDATYGMIYKTLIEQGAEVVMAGHIAQPAYEDYFGLPEGNRIIPATLSPNLLQKLLREKLGFNGVICTDASAMLGLSTAEKREIAIPKIIASGCDILLFNFNLQEDFTYMMKGLQDGLLTTDRLDEAVIRILALKASLKLHIKSKEGRLFHNEEELSVIGCQEHIRWTEECADKSITLVKDTQNLLPINPVKHRRVLLYPLDGNELFSAFMGGDKPKKFFDDFVGLMENRGFEVTTKYKEEPDFPVFFTRTVEKFKQDYDLVIYLINLGTASNQTTIRLNFNTFTNVPWFVREVPTMLISLSNPYHLLDAPMIRTAINAYTFNPQVVEAVVDKICGTTQFHGISPVDPFCGRVDTKL